MSQANKKLSILKDENYDYYYGFNSAPPLEIIEQSLNHNGAFYVIDYEGGDSGIWSASEMMHTYLALQEDDDLENFEFYSWKEIDIEREERILLSKEDISFDSMKNVFFVYGKDLGYCDHESNTIIIKRGVFPDNDEANDALADVYSVNKDDILSADEVKDLLRKQVKRESQVPSVLDIILGIEDEIVEEINEEVIKSAHTNAIRVKV